MPTSPEFTSKACIIEKISPSSDKVTRINPNLEYLNPKQIQMTEILNSKRYDLEERTQKFAKNIIEFVNSVPKTLANIEIAKQLIRSAGSVGANYIEANEALSKKDFVLRVKICRKEAKESKYWPTLLQLEKEDMDKRRQLLGNEITELMKIFGAIIEKSR